MFLQLWIHLVLSIQYRQILLMGFGAAWLTENSCETEVSSLWENSSGTVPDRLAENTLDGLTYISVKWGFFHETYGKVFRALMKIQAHAWPIAHHRDEEQE
ncbi:hypothetical protein V6N11_018048 [Hibiscus sabdariffa]|uniref:Secreted protein n=1 Tax=Hibiscus sabdariffa TaxID=183260 RepID=A0ABR2T761_9ROSI